MRAEREAELACARANATARARAHTRGGNEADRAQRPSLRPPYPALQAKTTKKITLRMECKECKYKCQRAWGTRAGASAGRAWLGTGHGRREAREAGLTRTQPHPIPTPTPHHYPPTVPIKRCKKFEIGAPAKK